jgi:hypothetical protein
MSAVFIILGCIGLIVAVMGKEFSVADSDAISSFNQRMPTWLGRLIAAIAGTLLLAYGIKTLFFN